MVRRCRGLTILSLGNSPITTLPDWLAELPRLELIDAADLPLRDVPTLAGVQWDLNAETLRVCADRIDPGAVVGVTITSYTSAAAVEHVLDVTRRGTITVRRLGLTGRPTGTVEHAGRDQTAELWSTLALIEATLDDLLLGLPDLESLHIWGCPLSCVPESLLGLRKLRRITIGGVWPAYLPDWLFSLPDLRELDLSFNDLADLPRAIGEAQGLTSLDLGGNSLTHVPEVVWELQLLPRPTAVPDRPPGLTARPIRARPRG